MAPFAKKKLIDFLENQRRKCSDSEYFVVVCEPTARAGPHPYRLFVAASPNLKDLQVGQELEWRVANTVRSSQQQARVSQSLGLRFDQLPVALVGTFTAELLDKLIPSRRRLFPWGPRAGGTPLDYDTAAVRELHPWFPVTVSWRNPAQMTGGELQQILEAAFGEFAAAALDSLLPKVLQRCNVNAQQHAQLSAAFKDMQKQQETGTAAEHAQPAFTGAGTLVSIELDQGRLHCPDTSQTCLANSSKPGPS